MEFRERGNQYFSERKYEQALACYSDAIVSPVDCEILTKQFYAIIHGKYEVVLVLPYVILSKLVSRGQTQPGLSVAPRD